MKISILTIGLSVLVSGSILFADDNYGYKKNSINLSVQPALYKEECASCHMGFQAEFLPQKSWKKLMAKESLADHFGDDASFDEKDREAILNYLLQNSADAKRVGKYYRKFANSIWSFTTPIAISELPKFKDEHDEIPARLIKQKEVKTISNCMACHSDATKGWYSERNINIPKYGRWDD